jgi:glycerol kinase
LGVAFLAGMKVGIYDSLDEITALWAADKSFQPQMDKASGDALYQGWQKAVDRVRTNSQ